jgi:uncharacterized membrane protein YjjP (DUF1212 family)
MATKEMKTLLITAGTAFLSGGILLISTGNYTGSAILAIVGMAAFYESEIIKEEEITLLKRNR